MQKIDRRIMDGLVISAEQTNAEKLDPWLKGHPEFAAIAKRFDRLHERQHRDQLACGALALGYFDDEDTIELCRRTAENDLTRAQMRDKVFRLSTEKSRQLLKYGFVPTAHEVQFNLLRVEPDKSEANRKAEFNV